ncbi:MAG: glycosyltransferase family 2 protein [Elusimicrobiales bacterium]|nr:glycosyltransferase family 2 protein [Elusimicrobiales bacterium]
MKLSIVMPAHNEEQAVEPTIRALYERLSAERIDHEILVVNDNSSDGTEAVLGRLRGEVKTLRVVNNTPPHGFGFAVRLGLKQFTGDAVVIMMADGSDTPEDVVRFFRVLTEKNVDCVFGTRFSKGGRVVDYPPHKYVLNRLANRFLQALFFLPYDDVTNAFKLYRRQVIEGLNPLISYHFNLTVELPLKAIVRGYTYAVVPNVWINRKSGVSKLRIQEMGSRYLFITLYCLLEKWLSKGDYHRREGAGHL